MKYLDIFLILVAACLIMIAGISLYRMEQAKKRCTAAAIGKLESMEKVPQSDKGPKKDLYSPRISYDVNGYQYVNVSDYKTEDPNEFAPGQQIPIKYNHEKPDEFYIQGKEKTGRIYTVMIVIAVVLLVFAFVEI